MTIQILTGHTSFQTAHITPDYPYGFKLRCKRAIWIETATKGSGKGQQRIMTATTNPKRGDIWNKPKASTYSLFKILYIDPDTGYVESTGFNGFHRTEFLEEWGPYLTEQQTKIVNAYAALDRQWEGRTI